MTAKRRGKVNVKGHSRRNAKGRVTVKGYCRRPPSRRARRSKADVWGF